MNMVKIHKLDQIRKALDDINLDDIIESGFAAYSVGSCSKFSCFGDRYYYSNCSGFDGLAILCH